MKYLAREWEVSEQVQGNVRYLDFKLDEMKAISWDAYVHVQTRKRNTKTSPLSKERVREWRQQHGGNRRHLGFIHYAVGT